MVNTFLIDADFTISASMLDSPKRLGKQRLESYQLLSLLHAVQHISRLLGWTEPPLDATLLVKRKWLRDLHSEYLKQPWRLRLEKATTPRCFILEPAEPGPARPLGWINHTVTALWLGYDIALMAYINAHIHTWIGRGYKNTMVTYDVPATYPRPPWTYSAAFHASHKAALLAKELGQNRRGIPEKPWYQTMPQFSGIEPKIAYDWWPDGSQPTVGSVDLPLNGSSSDDEPDLEW